MQRHATGGTGRHDASREGGSVRERMDEANERRGTWRRKRRRTRREGRGVE